MASKRFTKGLVIAWLLFGLTATAMADHRQHGYGPTSVSTSGYTRVGSRPLYDYAPVISSEPILRYVTVKTPVRECWQDTEYHRVDRPVPGSGASTLAGAIIGGVIGHQFGSGRGNDAATVAGTLIGAAVGNSSARKRYGADYSTVEYARPVERCETRMTERTEERIDGYRVAYRYNGQKYVTQMPYDPGREIRVRVDVAPAG